MIAIIDFGVGNLLSVYNMLARLGKEAVITSKPTEIQSADHLIIPGVGHFDTCMRNFRKSGLLPVVEDSVLEKNIPVLGICVGAQMMTHGSEEGVEQGLGWIDGNTVLFRASGGGTLKIPHMGWSDLLVTNPSPLWRNLPPDPRFYFAHSYHFILRASDQVTGSAHYGYLYACAFAYNNIYGVQFHPEKSHRYGMQVLKNFAEL